jgi:hypothetical protein
LKLVDLQSLTLVIMKYWNLQQWTKIHMIH